MDAMWKDVDSLHLGASTAFLTQEVCNKKCARMAVMESGGGKRDRYEIGGTGEWYGPLLGPNVWMSYNVNCLICLD
jgi:hypothetical protein